MLAEDTLEKLILFRDASLFIKFLIINFGDIIVSKL